MPPKRKRNNLTRFREDRLMSKAELARAAGISPLTVDRVEKGYNCRLSTKRKIIKALGIALEKAQAVFPTFTPTSPDDQKQAAEPKADAPAKKAESAPNGANAGKQKKKVAPAKKETPPSPDGGERSASTTSP